VILDAASLQLLEIFERGVNALTGEPVQCPEQQHVKAAAISVGQHRPQSRPRAWPARTTERVAVFGDDLPTASGRELAQLP
jgi:hypothetical protein